jgi:hypothetical protein
MHRIFARLAYAFAVVIAMALLLEAGLWASGRPDPAAFRFE